MKFAAPLFTLFFLTTFHVMWSRQPVFEFGSTDFPALVESGTYIDKSLIVKAFAEEYGLIKSEEYSFIKPKIFIAAPRNFGKTINILTLKHYFGIEVDEDGNEIVDKRKTKNYSLFKKLKIFKHSEFFNATFGRHPVIHVDYEPLNRITNNRTMHENFKTVILETFLQHKYLLNVKNPNISQSYKNYIERDLEKKNPEQIDFKYSTLLLNSLLSVHFNQKTITLFDNCDALFNAIVFGNTSEDVGRLVYHYHTMFDYHNCLATGTFYIFDNLTSNYEGNNEETPYPHFWGFRGGYYSYWNHRYSEYYGIDDRELCELLKFTNNSSEADMIKADVSKFYGIYAGIFNNRTVYNTLSVLKYLQNRKLGDPHALRSYWETPTFIKSIIHSLLNQKTVRKIALSVLKNETYHLKTFGDPYEFYLWDAELLKEYIHEGFRNKEQTDYLFEYLASLSYFHIIREGKTLVIPNLEIRTEIENILRRGVSDDGNNK